MRSIEFVALLGSPCERICFRFSVYVTRLLVFVALRYQKLLRTHNKLRNLISNT